MLRGKVLTTEARAKIDAYRDSGLSNREIPLKMNKSAMCIHNYLRLGENYDKNQYTGSNRILTKRDHLRICKEIVTGNQTAREVTTILDLPVTIRRVQQILNTDHRLNWTKRAIRVCTKPYDLT